MCGIAGFISSFQQPDGKRIVKDMIESIRHRGPDDWDLCYPNPACVIGHCRLHIIDDSNSQKQPFRTKGRYTCINGEIYNFIELTEKMVMETNNDCEVVHHLLSATDPSMENIIQILGTLDGPSCICHYSEEKLFIARDRVGINSLYYAYDGTSFYFSSEIKGLPKAALVYAKELPPGTVVEMRSTPEGKLEYNSAVFSSTTTQWLSVSYSDITYKNLLMASVHKRLSNVKNSRVALLVSGGLDSSTVAACAKVIADDIKVELVAYTGVVDGNASDLHPAIEICNSLNIKHKVVKIPLPTESEMEKTVFITESYDVTTVRCAYLFNQLAKTIRDDGFSVCLTGEGADEALGGYLYMHLASSSTLFEAETERLISELHMFDVKRAHMTGMNNSLEFRYPFLDNTLLSYTMGTRGDFRQSRPEKKSLRRVAELLGLKGKAAVQRQKEQLSDGISYRYIDSLKTMFNGGEREAYKCYFEKHFAEYDTSNIRKRWSPKWQILADPSGRSSALHCQSNAREPINILEIRNDR